VEAKAVSETTTEGARDRAQPSEELGDGLDLNHVWVEVDGKEVVRGATLRLERGQVHALMGPNGIGGLWGRRELLEAMPLYMGGGEMIRKVTEERSTYAELPYKFEAGTPAIGQAVALGAAVDYLTAVGMERVWEHTRWLSRYAVSRLREIPGVTVYGDAPERGGRLLSTWRTFIRTIWPRFWTRKALRCGPVITARSR
jgi:hypothetical protein